MQRRSFAQPNQEPPPDDAALFDRYGSVIFAYILKHVSLREDAEDLTLEVFTAALEKNNLRHLQAEEQLAWLKRVAHNKLIDTYRRAQRRISVNIDIVAETLFDDEEPEEVALQRESYHQLHEHIQQLPPLQQQILYLRYAYNLRFAEIGTLLNKREGAVRQLLSRARTMLRASYLSQEQKGERSC
jgi:RNA polymerase sigma-70 factor (ECF subfamily)